MDTILKLKVSTRKKSFALKWSETEKVLIVEAVNAPEKGAANKEILRELKKFFNAETKIVSGLTNKKKLITVNLIEQEMKEKLKSIKTN